MKWTSFKESLPFVSRVWHKEYIDKLERDYQIRLNAATERVREQERSRLDPYLRVLSSYAICQQKEPPFEWRFELNIDPAIGISLRDPSLGQDIRYRESMANSIANQLHFHIVSQIIYGLRDMQKWERFK